MRIEDILETIEREARRAAETVWPVTPGGTPFERPVEAEQNPA